MQKRTVIQGYTTSDMDMYSYTHRHPNTADVAPFPVFHNSLQYE